MNRQTLIRGVALGFMGISASAFAAQYFLASPQTTSRVAQQPAAPDGAVVGASVFGASPTASETRQVSAAPQSTAPASSWLAETPLDAEPEPVLVLETPEIPLLLTPDEPVEQFAALDLGLSSDPTDTERPDFRPDLSGTLTLAQAEVAETVAPCAASLQVSPSIDALLDVRVTAPCHADQRLVISHADLAISGYTDTDGSYSVFLPALTQDAQVDVFLSDDTFLQASARVDDLDRFHRVILQWTGHAGLGLHVSRTGGTLMEPLQLSRTNPFDPELEDAFILTLGEARGPEPMLAEIYSVPADMVHTVALWLEAEVSKQTCGRDLQAYLLQLGPDLRSDIAEVTLAMPICDGTPGFVSMPVALDRSGHASYTPREIPKQSALMQ